MLYKNYLLIFYIYKKVNKYFNIIKYNFYNFYGMPLFKNKKTADNVKSKAIFQELNYNETNEQYKNIQKEEFQKNSDKNKTKNDEKKPNIIKQEKKYKNEEEDIYKYIKGKKE